MNINDNKNTDKPTNCHFNTVKPVYNHHIMAKSNLDELQKADIFSTSKMVPSVWIKAHYWTNHM